MTEPLKISFSYGKFLLINFVANMNSNRRQHPPTKTKTIPVEGKCDSRGKETEIKKISLSNGKDGPKESLLKQKVESISAGLCKIDHKNKASPTFGGFRELTSRRLANV